MSDAEVMQSSELRQVEKSIHVKGHSTALDAGVFAKEMSVKNLVLNHISNRYDFLDDVHYREAVKGIQEVASVLSCGLIHA